jgi:hypothetical protein
MSGPAPNAAPEVSIGSEYAFDFTIDRRPEGSGASVTVQTPSLEAPLDCQLRGEVGYGTLLLDDVLPAGDPHGSVGVGMFSLGGVVEWRGFPAAAPAVRADVIYADVHSDELSVHRQAVGGRGAVTVEVPLTFMRDDSDDDDDDSASLVIQFARVFGLPRAEKLDGRPDVLNGNMASFGLRFYL